MATTVLAASACGSGSAAEQQPESPTQTQVTAVGTGVVLKRVATLGSPTSIAAPSKDQRRIFVTEKAGAVRVIRGGKLLPRPFLDLRSKVVTDSEQGLLGLAFSPDYADSGLFYVYYTAKDGRQVLEEYRHRSGETADRSSVRRLFAHDDPESNHNGGQLQFGPDGLLYVGTGDGGGGGDVHGKRGNAQDLSSPLGKLLRIDPRAGGGRTFQVPASNPFVGRKGALPEIYSYGLRNPWRFSFDRSTGAIVIADVGQEKFEEVNYLAKGKARGTNFGWRVYEGKSRYSPSESAANAVPPVLTLSHDNGYCSITGGYVVRDRALRGLYGRYLFADFCKSGMRSVKLSSGRATGLRLVPGTGKLSSSSTFGEDSRGRIYVASLDGPVYRLASR